VRLVLYATSNGAGTSFLLASSTVSAGDVTVISAKQVPHFVQDQTLKVRRPPMSFDQSGATNLSPHLLQSFSHAD